MVYSNASKSEMLGVPEEIILTHGAVSAETAESMARAIREMSGADLGLATTGIAGPTGGTEEKPVGTVYIALAHDHGVEVNHFRFYGDRSQIKTLAAQTALNMGLKHLQK